MSYFSQNPLAHTKNLLTTSKSTAHIIIVLNTCRVNVELELAKLRTWSFNLWSHIIKLHVRRFPNSTFTNETIFDHVKI